MFVKILSIKVAVSLVILVGLRIIGKKRLEVNELKNIRVGVCVYF